MESRGVITVSPGRTLRHALVSCPPSAGPTKARVLPRLTAPSGMSSSGRLRYHMNANTYVSFFFLSVLWPTPLLQYPLVGLRGASLSAQTLRGDLI